MHSMASAVAEKEFQYRAEAFEAFQGSDKAKEMTSRMAMPIKDTDRLGKNR